MRHDCSRQLGAVQSGQEHDTHAAPGFNAAGQPLPGCFAGHRCMQQRCTSAAGNHRGPQLGQEPNSCKLHPAHRPSAEQVHCFLLLIHIRTRHMLCADALHGCSLDGADSNGVLFTGCVPFITEGRQASGHQRSKPALCRAAPAVLPQRQLASQTLHRVNRRRSSRGSSCSQRGGDAGGPRAAAAPAPRPSRRARPTSLAPWPKNGAPATVTPFWHEAVIC